MQHFGIIASVITVLFAGAIHIFHDSVNVYLMGFFRDLARIKARKRRMSNDMALSSSSSSSSGLSKKDIQMLFFKQEEEDPLEDVGIHFDIDSHDGTIKVVHQNNSNNNNNEGVDTDSNRNSDSPSASSLASHEYGDLAEYTREELYEFGRGDNEEGVLLLSLYGQVYDVTEGWKHYGEGGKYHKFAGRDVTRALSTGCMAESCLGSIDTPPSKSSSSDNDAYNIVDFELTPKVIAEGKKWVSFFETHDSYHLVGVLRDGRSMDELIDAHLEIHDNGEEEEKEEET